MHVWHMRRRMHVSYEEEDACVRKTFGSVTVSCGVSRSRSCGAVSASGSPGCFAPRRQHVPEPYSLLPYSLLRGPQTGHVEKSSHS